MTERQVLSQRGGRDGEVVFRAPPGPRQRLAGRTLQARVALRRREGAPCDGEAVASAKGREDRHLARIRPQSESDQHKQNFQDTLRQMRDANDMGRRLKYRPAYSNFTFDLCMTLLRRGVVPCGHRNDTCTRSTRLTMWVAGQSPRSATPSRALSPRTAAYRAEGNVPASPHGSPLRRCPRRARRRAGCHTPRSGAGC